MKYIVPAAGFGTRMGMAINQSKELLIDPSTGLRLIDNVLRDARTTGAAVHVITRAEKTDLIDYLATQIGVTVQIINPKGEWAETVLQSEPFWEQNNVLILPDTVWEPRLDTLLKIEASLELGCDSVFAIHEVDDVKNWGAVGWYSVTEKPELPGSGYAWGLIGFTDDANNYDLFDAMTTKNNTARLQNSSFIFLDSFKDLTRTGKIE